MEIIKGSWLAIGNCESYRIIQKTKLIEPTTFAGHSSIEGISSLKTECGLAVNRIEKGSYQIVQTGELLKSNDPTAP